MPDEWVSRPDCPKAASYDIAECSNPECGPHLISLDENGRPICETVFSHHGARRLIAQFQAMLYGKAVEGDDDR
jgi:hypothetical protein